MDADTATTRQKSQQLKDEDQIIADQAAALIEKPENLISSDDLYAEDTPASPAMGLMGNAFLNQQGATGALRPTDDYPMLQRPIQAGVYQGSVIGAVPIFSAPGGRIPHGVIRDRQAALQGMAMQRAKMKEKLYKVALSPGPALHNERLTELGFDTINEMLDEHGSWDAILRDPKLKSEMDKRVLLHKARVNGMNYIQSKIEQLTNPETLSDRALYIPNDVLAVAEKFQSTPTDELYSDLGKLRDMNERLQSYTSVQTAIESAKEKGLLDADQIYSEAGLILDRAMEDDEVAGKIKDAVATFKRTNDYDLYAYNLVKAVSPERIAPLANLVSQSGTFHKDHNEEYIAKAIMASSEVANEMKTVLAEKYNVSGRKSTASASLPKERLGVVSMADSMIFDDKAKMRPEVTSVLTDPTLNAGQTLQALSTVTGMQWRYDKTNKQFASDLTISDTERRVFESSANSLIGNSGYVVDETGSQVLFSTYAENTKKEFDRYSGLVGNQRKSEIDEGIEDAYEKYADDLNRSHIDNYLNGLSGNDRGYALSKMRSDQIQNPDAAMYGKWQVNKATVQMMRKVWSAPSGGINEDARFVYVPVNMHDYEAAKKSGDLSEIEFITAIEYIAVDEAIQPGADKNNPAEGSRTVLQPSGNRTRLVRHVPMGTRDRFAARQADGIFPGTSTATARDAKTIE